MIVEDDGEVGFGGGGLEKGLLFEDGFMWMDSEMFSYVWIWRGIHMDGSL